MTRSYKAFRSGALLFIVLAHCFQTRGDEIALDTTETDSESAESSSYGAATESPDERKMRTFSLIAPRTSTNVVTPSSNTLNDVEPEPGLAWPPVIQAPPPTHAPSSPTSADESLAGRMTAHFQRISERLTSMESLQIQTLRKLEGLDYRLTKVEVQMQERSETVKGMSADASRRLQQLEGDVNKIETLLDVVRDESTAIRSSQAELKLLLTRQSSNFQQQVPAVRGAAVESETQTPRLQLLMAGMNSLRTTANGLKEDLIQLHKNVSMLANLTKSVENRTKDLATKQDLNKGMAILKSQDSSPPKSLSHFTLGAACPNRNISALPRDCSEALSMGGRQSGIQQIQPLSSSAAFFVQCDMETRGGGWTVLQNRQDGTVNFLRDWSDYKHGFGNLATEFWLGLEKIHMITNQGVYELLIELTDFGLNQASAHYTAFAIGSDAEGYDIRLLGTYTGDAGDSLAYHTAMKFSTPDNDQDQWFDGNCARDHTGGWWYRGCDTSNLNGQYLNGPVPIEFEYKGMYWYDYQGPMYSLMKSKMMVRPFANAVGFNIQSGTTAKPRPPQVPPPGNLTRPTQGPKGAQQGQKQKKKKDGE